MTRSITACPLRTEATDDAPGLMHIGIATTATTR